MSPQVEEIIIVLSPFPSRNKIQPPINAWELNKCLLKITLKFGILLTSRRNAAIWKLP